jgi:hypothetical protein
MAVQFKVNPTQPNIARSFNGKSVSTFVVTPLTNAAGAVNFTNELGANGAFQAILQVLTQYTTPIMISAAADITQPAYTFFFEGDFGTDNWNDPAATQAFEVYLRDAIRALGATAAVRSAALAAVTGETVSAGVDLRGTTVARGVVYQVDQINASGVPYVR